MMHPSTEPESSRKAALHAAVLILGLVVPLVIVWDRDGPPAYRAFWLVMSYFVELAIWMVVEIVRSIIRGRGSGT